VNFHPKSLISQELCAPGSVVLKSFHCLVITLSSWAFTKNNKATQRICSDAVSDKLREQLSHMGHILSLDRDAIA
jgi:hypothetical protein